MSATSARPENLERYVTVARQMQAPLKDAAAAALNWYDFGEPKPWSLYGFSNLVPQMTFLEDQVEVICRTVAAADGPVADAAIQKALRDAGIPLQVCTAFGPPIGYDFAEAIQAFDLIAEFIREGRDRSNLLDCLEDLDPEEREYVFERLSDEHRVWLLNDVKDNWSFEQRRRFYDLLLSSDCMFTTCFQHISPEDLELLYNIPPSLWETTTSFIIGVPIGIAKALLDLIKSVPELVSYVPEILDLIGDLIKDPGTSLEEIAERIQFLIDNWDELLYIVLEDLEADLEERPGEVYGRIVFEVALVFLTAGASLTVAGFRVAMKTAKAAKIIDKSLDVAGAIRYIDTLSKYGRIKKLPSDPPLIFRQPESNLPVFRHPETNQWVAPADLSSSTYKGSFGEYIGTFDMVGKGHQPVLDRIELGSNDLQVLDRGIDQIYKNANPPPPLLVVETKYRSGQPFTIAEFEQTNAGLQMSEEWIRSDAQRLLDSDSISIDIYNSLLDKEYGRILQRVDQSGKIEYVDIDSGAVIHP